MLQINCFQILFMYVFDKDEWMIRLNFNMMNSGLLKNVYFKNTFDMFCVVTSSCIVVV